MSYNFLDKTGLTYLWGKIKAYITKKTIPLIEGTQASSTSAWTGVAPFSELVDGQVINFYLPFASTSTAVTLNLTLSSGGTTGALPVYYDNGTGRMTIHFGRGSIITLMYKASRVNSSGTTITNSWLHISDRDTTDVHSLRIENGSIIAGANGVKQNSLCAMDSTGKYRSFTTTDGTGTSKTVNSSAKFRNPMLIFKNNSDTNYASDAEVGTGYQSYYAQATVDLRYCCNDWSAFTKNTPTYLECSKDSDGYFSVSSSIIVQPQNDFLTGYYYIYLGNTRRDQAYYMTLQPNHPVFYYDGTKLIGENELKQNKLATQTAYSAKGSATKVPQITTNTLGQVTGITEVDIDTSGEIEDFTNKITFNESNYPLASFKIKNGVAYCHYNGPSKTHTNGTIILTIPSGYRPQTEIFVPFVKGGNCYGRVWFPTDGKVQVSGISNTASTDRMNFSATYIVQ